MKKRVQRITIDLRGEGSHIDFKKEPSLMDLALSVNVLMSVMQNNFDSYDIELAIDAAWHKLANIEEVYKV